MRSAPSRTDGSLLSARWPGAHKKKAPRAIGCGGRGGLEHELRPLQALPSLACYYGLLRDLKAHTNVCVGRDPSVGLRFLFLRLRPHCCGGRYGTRSAWRRYCVCYPCVSLQRLLRFRLLTGSDDCREASVLVGVPAATPGRICTSEPVPTGSWLRRAPTRRNGHFHHTPATPVAGSPFQTVPSFARSGPTSGQPLPHRYSTNLPLLCLPGCHTRSKAVRASHVICSLLRSAAPPCSKSCHRYAYPPREEVSAPRDSKAGDLPGKTLQRTPDYALRRNGSADLHTAPLAGGAVTRLSYTGAPGFPRCRQSQISPLRPSSFRNRCQPSCVALVILCRPHRLPSLVVWPR